MGTLFSTAYFPSVLYMAEIIQTDEIIIEAFESYPKRTSRNHCAIYGPNGLQKLTVPVIRVDGNHTFTKNIRISNHNPWQTVHLRSIETAYHNSPFFLFYMDYLFPFFEKKFSFLIDLNLELLQVLLTFLKTEKQVRFSTSFEKVPVGLRDLRNEKGLVKIENQALYPSYTQVFEPRHGFFPGLSILDLILNLGPEAPGYLKILNENIRSID